MTREADMDVVSDVEVRNDKTGASVQHGELIERIDRLVPDEGIAEPLEGLMLRRAVAPTEVGHGVTEPSFCVIAQGGKEIFLGDRCYRYDPAHYLVATAAVPIATRITDASPERPYLGVVLRLDPALVASVMVEAGRPAPRGQSEMAIDVSPLDDGLLDAVVRLVRLVDQPGDARFLAPLVTREIVYRLLTGAQGTRLRDIAALGGDGNRIAQAIERLREDFDRPLRIENLARELGMSVSSFHHHFKIVTAMSPLQFQKQLRLQEARRLMLGEGYDATTAGYRVGYSETSHFNREYKRLFGEPPARDVARLRSVARQDTGL